MTITWKDVVAALGSGTICKCRRCNGNCDCREMHNSIDGDYEEECECDCDCHDGCGQHGVSLDPFCESCKGRKETHRTSCLCSCHGAISEEFEEPDREQQVSAAVAKTLKMLEKGTNGNGI